MHLKTNSRGRQQGFSEAGVSRQVGFVVVLAAGHCLTEPCCDGLAEWRDPSKTPVFDEPVPRPSGKRRDARTARPAVEVLISHVRGRPSRLVLPCRYQSLCLSSRDSPGAFPPATWFNSCADSSWSCLVGSCLVRGSVCFGVSWAYWFFFSSLIGFSFFAMVDPGVCPVASLLRVDSWCKQPW